MRLGGVREMHWHKAAEWAYMLKARITAIDQDGRTLQDDIGEGDLWYFTKCRKPSPMSTCASNE
jgi:oxalate decarboxylase